MKLILFLTSIMLLAGTAKGQKTNKPVAGYGLQLKDYPIADSIILVNPYIGRDTIQIKDTSIHFIKMGSYMFMIYKNIDGDTTLERAYRQGELMEMWRRKDSIIHAQTGMMPK